MIGKIVGVLLGRKVKTKVVDSVLSKIELPDPVEASIKAAATGKIDDLVADITKKVLK